MVHRAFLALAALALQAGEIILPSPALPRSGQATVIYRTNPLGTGRGTLHVKWTDAHGRVVEDSSLAVELNDEAEIRFPLDLTRAAAMKNQLEARLVFEGKNAKAEADKRDETAKASFIATPPDKRWWDYQIMMWQNHTAAKFEKLKPLGISGGQYNGRNRTIPEFLLNNDLRWYAENIATDFYAEYHRWRPDRRPNAPFYQALELYKRDPSSKEAFKRHPSFSDPAWRKRIEERLVESARFWSPYRPLFYSLADEAGIADLSQFWDFDFSDQSLVEMREWLKERYGTLAALNRQWGTKWETWQAVRPETTDEAMKREDGNYSSWADHKEWMDVSFAQALRMGTDAVHRVDPAAYVGILGAQMPGWGGYDYARLVKAVTMLEPYDIGNNHEIIRSLAPQMPVITTAFASGPWEKHRVWFELLHGNRGLVLWDDKSEFVGDDLAVAARGKEAQPYFREIRGGVGALLINSIRQHDPIAIHYSQASLRTEWMREQRPKGKAWINRKASTERLDSEFMRLRESWCRVIEDLGFQYRFVAYDQVEAGELARGGYRVLVLPRSSALSEREAEAISAWVRAGGVAIVDGEAGTYDEHSRKLSEGRLAGLMRDPGQGRVVAMPASLLNYHQDRLRRLEQPAQVAVGKTMAEAGLRPMFRSDAGIGVETHVFRNGGGYLVGLLSNPQQRVNELGPPDFKSNSLFERTRQVRLALPGEMEVYDIRGGKALGRQRVLEVSLDPYEPALFLVAGSALPKVEARAPARARRGETVQVSIASPNTPLANTVYHVEVRNPAGEEVPHYSGNLLAPGGRGAKSIPLARNDAAGRWEVRVREVATGATASVAVVVE